MKVCTESTQQESQKRVYLDYFDELSETSSSLEEVGLPETVDPSEMVSPSEIVDSPVYCMCYDVLSMRGESLTDMDFSAT